MGARVPQKEMERGHSRVCSIGFALKDNSLSRPSGKTLASKSNGLVNNDGVGANNLLVEDSSNCVFRSVTSNDPRQRVDRKIGFPCPRDVHLELIEVRLVVISPFAGVKDEGMQTAGID